ncbi:DUF4406 domain-containing protein [Vibrio alginolyticus]|nr:DUF4406 domain-containing protein [Vibrio alginolyticus]
MNYEQPRAKAVVYISGPMTGIEQYNHPAFNEVSEDLKAHGYVVLNPATLPLGLTDEAYMDIGLAMVRASDCVVLLDGYKQSKGAMAEKAYAERIKIPCLPIDELH